jgi:S-adenosylmethionine hydrolase
MSLIALLTDFGIADHYAGSVKAAILGINPRATLVDISHGIPPGDIVSGAFTLLLSYRDFPKGTIFVAVVDPGVGGSRAGIAIECGDCFFIGPDNGILALAAEKIGAPVAIRTLENKRFFRMPASSTFHGRDIFGPVAAHLSKGVSFERLGSPRASFIHCPLPQPIEGLDYIKGTIAYIDHFGNCITTIEASPINQYPNKLPKISVKRKKTIPFCSCYEDVPSGKPLAIIGSAGFIEISVHGASAAFQLKLIRGDDVVIRFA